MTPQESGLRLAVLQRVCPDYRVALFSALSAAENVEMRLFIGGISRIARCEAHATWTAFP